MNDRLLVSKIYRKSEYPWNSQFSQNVFTVSILFSVYKQNFTAQ